jgi:hypothetical protein
MYAYLRSQEGADARWNDAAGMLLHPATDESFHEHVVIQNHPISFATIALTSLPSVIRHELRELLQHHYDAVPDESGAQATVKGHQ